MGSMGTQEAAFHNPAVRSSGKVRRNSTPLSVARLAACRFAKCLGLPLTYRNLYVIELAIEAEVVFAEQYNRELAQFLAREEGQPMKQPVPVSIAQAAATIMDGAISARERGECVNYFWFEDCGWRQPKLSFKERDDLRFRARYRGL